MITIRRFRTADAAAVAVVIRAAMRETNTQDYPLGILQPLMDYFSPEKVERLATERYCLVAETDGRVVGTAARRPASRRVESSLTGATLYERHGYRRTGTDVTRTAGEQIEMTKMLA